MPVQASATAALDDATRAYRHSAAMRGPDASNRLGCRLASSSRVVVAIGGIQLMAAMDGPVAVFALPKIQNELGLSDAGRSWVITAYVLTFGGLILLGGRLGDTIGRKRTLIAGVALFTFASAICGIAWDGAALVLARLLHGAAAAIVVPTCMALVATTFPKGPARNAATAVFGAMGAIGAVLGLVVGGALTGVSWRLAFLVNVPIGLLVIYLARTMLPETQKERTRLDATGAVLATLICTATVFGLSMGPEKGWLSATTIGPGLVAMTAFVAFVVVERTAENPIVPFSLFFDRNRLATFAAMFLVRGISFTMTVLLAIYVQSIMGYSPLRAAIGFIPFAIAMAIGTAASSRLVTRFSPRVVVIAGGIVVLGATLYALDAQRQCPVLPELDAADRLRRYRPRHDQRPARAVVDRQRRRRPHRARLGDRGDAAEHRRTTGADRHSGRRHIADAAPGRDQRAGEGHERRPAACAGLRLHLRPAVAGRGGHLALRGGAAHRIHRAAGGACAEGQERHRCRSGVAQTIR